jgi:tripartite-type tricarboxylate transporter receptor subunit TctC
MSMFPAVKAIARAAGRRAGTLIAVAAAVLGANPSLGQSDYPSRSIRMIAPFAAGASGDLTARSLGDYFSKQWGQSVVVDNRPGAGGLIGANEAKRAAPDGYTLLLGYDAVTTFSLFVKDNTFDPLKDLAPVSLLVRYPLVLLTSTSLPVNDWNEFAAYAKANPGKVNFAITTNSPGHLAVLGLMKRAGLSFTLIPYPGAAALTQSVVSGESNATFSAYGAFAPHIKSGKARLIAVAGPNRLKQASSVATLREDGVDLVMPVWYALFGIAGTPEAIVNKLNQGAVSFLKTPAAELQFDRLDMEIVASTPAELARTVVDEMKFRAEAAKVGNLQPQ